MEIAESVMTQRQNGASIAKLLDVNDFAFKNSADKTMKNVINHIIMDAFQEPYYNLPSLKRSQLTDFSAKYYIACMMM
ncbi:hypothetical protein APD01_00160 [Acinetobacter soli]|nr:hypothetical protein APD01_00160 [Acinetobacter soli]